MISIESYLRLFEKETDICIRLYAKIPPGGLDYRPTLGQRSTLELLRYLSFGPYNAVRRIVAGDWMKGAPTNEVTKDWPASDFVRNMQWQAKEVRILLSQTRLDLLMTQTVTFPWGQTILRSDALVEYAFNWLASYRMQLFLYLKAAGAKELSTPDVWR
jgi:hypothetical protein